MSLNSQSVTIDNLETIFPEISINYNIYKKDVENPIPLTSFFAKFLESNDYREAVTLNSGLRPEFNENMKNFLAVLQDKDYKPIYNVYLDYKYINNYFACSAGDFIIREKYVKCMNILSKLGINKPPNPKNMCWCLIFGYDLNVQVKIFTLFRELEEYIINESKILFPYSDPAMIIGDLCHEGFFERNHNRVVLRTSVLFDPKPSVLSLPKTEVSKPILKNVDDVKQYCFTNDEKDIIWKEMVESGVLKEYHGYSISFDNKLEKSSLFGSYPTDANIRNVYNVIKDNGNGRYNIPDNVQKCLDNLDKRYKHFNIDSEESDSDDE